jgi:hypothetical protein
MVLTKYSGNSFVTNEDIDRENEGKKSQHTIETERERENKNDIREHTFAKE